MARLAMVVGLTTGLAGAISPAPDTDNVRINSRIGCDRTVTWTAGPTADGSSEQNTNNRVEISSRVAGTRGAWTVVERSASFTFANQFRSTGTFTLPDGAEGVDIRVRPIAKWGSTGRGEAAGNPSYSSAVIPERCHGLPLSASAGQSCAEGGVLVTLRNTGDIERSASIDLDDVTVRDVAVAPGHESTVVVPLLSQRTSMLTVRWVGSELLGRTVRSECHEDRSVAVVVEHCPQRAARVSVQSPTPGSVTLIAGGVVLATGQVGPGSTVDQIIALPPTPIRVEVRVNGATVSDGMVGGCAEPLAGTVTCGVPGAASCPEPTRERISAPLIGTAVAQPSTPAPPPPPPPLEIERELAHTGPWGRGMLLTGAGAALALGGSALTLQYRRRDRLGAAMAISAALAPYRQTWWQD